MEHHDSCHGTFLFVCETLAHRLFHSEANPGRLRPIGRSQHLLTQAARDRETTESLGQNRVVRGTIVGTDRVARDFTGDTLHTQPPSQAL